MCTQYKHDFLVLTADKFIIIPQDIIKIFSMNSNISYYSVKCAKLISYYVVKVRLSMFDIMADPFIQIAQKISRF